MFINKSFVLFPQSKDINKSFLTQNTYLNTKIIFTFICVLKLVKKLYTNSLKKIKIINPFDIIINYQLFNSFTFT
jgi:hypothetical protein